MLYFKSKFIYLVQHKLWWDGKLVKPRIDTCIIYVVMQNTCFTFSFLNAFIYNNILCACISEFIFSTDQSAIIIFYKTENTIRVVFRLVNIFNCLAHNWTVKYKSLSSFPPAISTCWLPKQNSCQSSCELRRTYQQSVGVITKFSQHLNGNSCEDDKSK